MDKLTFERDFDDEIKFDTREPSKIEFTLPGDLDIHEFRLICIRLAASLGYHHTSIKLAFGDNEKIDNDLNHINQLLNWDCRNLDVAGNAHIEGDLTIDGQLIYSSSSQ